MLRIPDVAEIVRDVTAPFVERFDRVIALLEEISAHLARGR